MKKQNNCNLKWRIIGLLSAIAIFNAGIAIAQNNELSLKIMSYNIHHGNPPGNETMIDLKAIVKTIKKSGAAIVALQEVDVNTKRSGYINQSEVLAKKLKMHLFFSKAIDFDGGEYGLAILSKYPFAITKFHQLSSVADPEAEPRILQIVTINIPNQKPFIFANTHLDFLNNGNRVLQAEQIIGIAQNEKHPFIIAGDWNATLGSKTLMIMDKEFTRTCNICPVTCPEEGNKGAIDFIAYTKDSGFRTKNYHVFNDNHASDHYPILAEILLP